MKKMSLIGIVMALVAMCMSFTTQADSEFLTAEIEEVRIGGVLVEEYPICKLFVRVDNVVVAFVYKGGDAVECSLSKKGDKVKVRKTDWLSDARYFMGQGLNHLGEVVLQ